MSARQLARASILAASAILTIAALLVAGCGARPQTGGSAPTATPGSPASHLPTPGGSTPVMTNVIITTDQLSYTSGDTIHVTITNHTATPIFATSGKVNCSVVEAQMKTAQGWQTTQIAPCADAAMAELVQIAPKASRSASITAKSALAPGNVSPGAELLYLYRSSAPGRRIAQRRAACGRGRTPAEIQPADDGLLTGVHCRVGPERWERCLLQSLSEDIRLLDGLYVRLQTGDT